MYKAERSKFRQAIDSVDILLDEMHSNANQRSPIKEKDRELAQLHRTSLSLDNMEGYELQYKRDMQGLHIDKRSMETSMLAYTKKMKDLTITRGNKSLPSTISRTSDNQRWNSLTLLPTKTNFPKDFGRIPDRIQSANDLAEQPILGVVGTGQGQQRPVSESQADGIGGLFNNVYKTNAFHSDDSYNQTNCLRKDKSVRRNAQYNLPLIGTSTVIDEKSGSETSETPLSEEQDFVIESFPFPEIQITAITVQQPHRERKQRKKTFVHKPHSTIHHKAQRNRLSHRHLSVRITKLRPVRREHKSWSNRTNKLEAKFKELYAFKYSSAVEGAIEQVIGELNIESGFTPEVSNIPDMQDEVERVKARRAREQQQRDAERELKKQKQKAKQLKHTAHYNKNKNTPMNNSVENANEHNPSSKRDDELSTDSLNDSFSSTLKSVLKKEPVTDLVEKNTKKNVQFKGTDLELVRMITKLSEIHRRNDESNTETGSESDSNGSIDDRESLTSQSDAESV